MIRSADDKMAAGPKNLFREVRQIARSNEVLDHLRGDSHVKALAANRSCLVVHSELVEHQLWRRILCEPNAVSARLATNDFVSAACKLAA